MSTAVHRQAPSYTQYAYDQQQQQQQQQQHDMQAPSTASARTNMQLQSNGLPVYPNHSSGFEHSATRSTTDVASSRSTYPAAPQYHPAPQPQRTNGYHHPAYKVEIDHSTAGRDGRPREVIVIDDDDDEEEEEDQAANDQALPIARAPVASSSKRKAPTNADSFVAPQSKSIVYQPVASGSGSTTVGATKERKVAASGVGSKRKAVDTGNTKVCCFFLLLSPLICSNLHFSLGVKAKGRASASSMRR